MTGLPDIHAGSYVIEAMQTIGPTRSNGMGEQPTDWDIILPFAQATGRLTETWEMEALAAMCREYLRGRTQGESPFGIAPVDQVSSTT